jgi:hypothetical protein
MFVWGKFSQFKVPEPTPEIPYYYRQKQKKKIPNGPKEVKLAIWKYPSGKVIATQQMFREPAVEETAT